MEAAYHARDERDDHRRRVGATGVEMVGGKSMVGASKCPTTWTHKTALDSPSTGRRPIKQRGICRDRKNWATMMIFGGLDQRHRHAHEGSMKVDFGYVLALDVLPYPLHKLTTSQACSWRAFRCCGRSSTVLQSGLGLQLEVMRS